MKLLASFIVGGTLAVCLTGCGKSETDQADATTPEAVVESAETPEAAANQAPVVQEPQGLPGEAAVRTSMANKDYNGAVSQLMSMRGSLRPDQWTEYVTLQGEVRELLMEAAEQNRSAAEALMALRAATSGR